MVNWYKMSVIGRSVGGGIRNVRNSTLAVPERYALLSISEAKKGQSVSALETFLKSASFKERRLPVRSLSNAFQTATIGTYPHTASPKREMDLQGDFPRVDMFIGSSTIESSFSSLRTSANRKFKYSPTISLDKASCYIPELENILEDITHRQPLLCQ